jgi:long-chain acyl-CoA synthetase
MDSASVVSSTIRVAADLPFYAAVRYGDHPAHRFKRDGQWHDTSFAEVAEAVRDLGTGLIYAGVSPGDRVCVLADTRPEWSTAALAILAAGGIVVPIYATSSAEECAWVISNSGAGMLIGENAAQLAKIESISDQVPGLRTLIAIDPDRPERVTLAELAAEGRRAPDASELEARRRGIGADDPSVIIYTSGTTGPPKGCVLTHRNWLALCTTVEELSYLRDDDVVYLFLPLAHVFAQIVQFGCLYAGSTLAYFGGDVRQVVPELAEVRPTFVPSVPRIFEKVYTLVTAQVPADQLAQAVRLGLTVRELRRTGQEVPAELAVAFERTDALFAKVRGVFGGRVRQCLSGAAPISTDVLEFFHAAGVPVLEGYGMSETTAVGTVSTMDRFKLGTVGVAGPGFGLKIADDGEVLMSGPHVFAGYWQNPEATAETLIDGWVHTGDLGELDDDGFLTITGRKKDIIITAGGKNIAPANVENALRQSRWISHAVTFGDRRPYLVALLTLDAEEIVPWATANGLPTDLTELRSRPELLALVQGVVDEANSHFSTVSQVKRFALLDRDLGQETGELTPTLKVKRNVVYTQFADVYAALYS